MSNPIRTKIHAIRDTLNTAFLERGELVDAMLLALITKQHVCAISAPGASKSLACRGLAESITKAEYFENLLSKFSTEEDVFGPRSLSAMKADKWERVTTSTLITAHIALLDEVFKCNTMLNSLLSALNERIYKNGQNLMHIPLWTVLAASNELPQDDSLGALWDRFLIRLKLEYIKDDGTFDRLLDDDAGSYIPPCLLTLDELVQAHKEAMAIDAPSLAPEVKAALRSIRAQLAAEGVVVSDRRWKQSVKLLRAAAWLDGDDHVYIDHLNVLRFTLWSDEKQIDVVRAVLAKMDQGVIGDCQRIIDDALRQWEGRPKNPADYIAAQSSLENVLNDAIRKVRERCRQSGITRRAAVKVDAKLKTIDEARAQLRKDVARRWNLVEEGDQTPCPT